MGSLIAPQFNLVVNKFNNDNELIKLPDQLGVTVLLHCLRGCGHAMFIDHAT